MLFFGAAERLPAGARLCATAPVGHHLIFRDGLYHLADGQGRHKPLTIDFRRPPYSNRRGKEYLPRAFRGIEDIGDGTAGWGRDGWLLHQRGFRVSFYERNEYLIFLLNQALQLMDGPVPELIAGDSGENLRAHEAIYLDPMFPPRPKSAQVGREMQLLQLLLPAEQGAEELFQRARARAEGRLVVKRPSWADFLAGARPSYSIEAPNTRYDVYQINP